MKTVLSGRPNTPMRPWKGLLDETQIREIRAYIRQIPEE